MKVPGAGTYNPDFNSVKKEMPKYSMKARFNTLADKTNVPGPGAYNSQLNNKTDAPKYGFGSS
jgi:hypothetical protein